MANDVFETGGCGAIVQLQCHPSQSECSQYKFQSLYIYLWCAGNKIGPEGAAAPFKKKFNLGVPPAQLAGERIDFPMRWL